MLSCLKLNKLSLSLLSHLNLISFFFINFIYANAGKEIKPS